MAFKRSPGTGPLPADPEQLYRQLALVNQGPSALWLHQGDVLRAWHKSHRSNPDVAIELPTGAGKTLVGGLIGEFQRRVDRDRVVYACPTRQLARQTADKLTEYGIPNVLLIKKVKQWNAADRARYASANAVAVTVYHHVFNSNPALDDAQLLLLDDAHAAEGAVAGPWSLTISRRDAADVYQDVLSTLADAFDPLMVTRLRADMPKGHFSSTVHLASPLGVARCSADLESVLRSAVQTGRLEDDAVYAMKFLEGHVDRCLVYASYQQLLLRPLIAPTITHSAFASPARRIYMSATLGAGGELERSFGRRAVTRIPIPPGWEKQGTGRRLFCFPELTTDLAADPSKVPAWVSGVITGHGRAVVLTPDRRTAETVTEHLVPDQWPVLKAVQVEDDLDVFTSQARAVLVLNNRYDGIDLPDDDCRLVVLAGLPAKGDLQERFLHAELGAVAVLQERIRARIMQGAGRATRNSRDYAAVLLLGSDLASYVTRHDVQSAMHPEIHAELDFGYTNSDGTSSAEMLENLRVFTEHGPEWYEVDGDIRQAREDFERVDAPGSAELQRSARYEVAACDAIWQGEWQRALELIRTVLDELRGGQAPQRYAALWFYLAACIAHRLADQTGDAALRKAAAGFYDDARKAGRGTTWLSHLAAPAESAPPPPDLDPLDRQALVGVIAHAGQLARPAVFEAEVTMARAALNDTPRRPYEAALVVMGRLAGALPSEGDGGNDSAPDATWIFGRETWVTWEAKSEALPGGELGSGDVRQAGSHMRFTAAQRNESAPGDSVGFLVTPQAQIHPSARAVAEDHVYLLRPHQVLEVFDRLVRAWRAARTLGLPDLTPEALAPAFWSQNALPSQWLSALRAAPLRIESDSD